jgi:hypothetical protein
MTSHLEQDLLQYQRWRDRLLQALESFRAQIEPAGEVDVQQALWMYDMLESLRSDRMLIAFLAEFSRGKTELINALFFSAYKRRLLPSGIGRTTMCPTELFHDPAERPYLRLLPIETRETDDAVSALKRRPIEWIQVNLDMEDPERLAHALAKVVESKSVPVERARELGLYDEADPASTISEGRVQIPAWRHALVNIPHPMLTAGLSILDTPGLNALGTEPELTLATIPSAHAVLFLLATDTGVTRTDLDLWQRIVQPSIGRAVAVLNKVDLIWDELKSDREIAASLAAQVDQTARTLDLPRAHVVPVSAQKALIGRIRGDDALVERSGIEALESVIAAMIPERRRIIADRVTREFSPIVESTYQSMLAQLRATRSELTEMRGFQGKNREMVKVMLDKLERDRTAYQTVAANFRNTHAVVMKQGVTLQANLDPSLIDSICQGYRKRLHDQLFTIRLLRVMQELFDHFGRETNKILSYATQIQGVVDTLYRSFHEKYGFARLAPPPLELDAYNDTMLRLKYRTTAFCSSPMTVMQPQGVVIRKFYDQMVTEARNLFSQVSAEVEAWLRRALSPLTIQMREHEENLDRRVNNLREVYENMRSLEGRIEELDRRQATLGRRVNELEEVRAALAQPILVAQEGARAA